MQIRTDTIDPTQSIVALPKSFAVVELPLPSVDGANISSEPAGKRLKGFVAREPDTDHPQTVADLAAQLRGYSQISTGQSAGIRLVKKR